MDFLSRASHEAALIAQQLLASRSRRTLQQMQSLRDTLDQAARDLEAGPDLPEVDALAVGLAKAAEAEIHRVQEEAASRLETVQRQLTERTLESERLSGALAQAEAQSTALARDLQAAHERIEATERDLALTVEAHAEVEAALRGAQTECRQLTGSRTQLTQELTGAREAIERLRSEARELQASLDRAAAQRTELETTLAEAAGRLDEERRARAEERTAGSAAAAGLESRVRQLTEHVSVLESALQDAARVEARLRDEIASRQRALDTQTASAQEARAALAAERDALAAERDALAAEVAQARIRIDALAAHASGEEAARIRATAALEAGAGQLRALQAQLQDTSAHLATLESAVAARDARILELQSRAQGGRDAAGGSALEPAAGGGAEADTLRGEVDRMTSLFDASARAVNEMAAAETSEELLAELVKRLSIQFSRVAWFRLKGNRLEGELQVGFEEAGDFSKLVIPLTLDSLLSRAASSGTVESVTGADVPVRTGTPFGGTPTCAVALPITLNGTTLGIIYADDADMPESARSPGVHDTSIGFARLLAGQVIVLLVRHTHELKTLAELRQYAATLIQEARTMHQADLDAGKHPDQVRSRLKENIDCASQLYAYRAAMEGTAAAALLDDQIAEELTASTPFAQDLASVMGTLKADVRLTAEAS